jgi:hypothetical protein
MAACAIVVSHGYPPSSPQKLRRTRVARGPLKVRTARPICLPGAPFRCHPPRSAPSHAGSRSARAFGWVLGLVAEWLIDVDGIWPLLVRSVGDRTLTVRSHVRATDRAPCIACADHLAPARTTRASGTSHGVTRHPGRVWHGVARGGDNHRAARSPTRTVAGGDRGPRPRGCPRHSAESLASLVRIGGVTPKLLPQSVGHQRVQLLEIPCGELLP